MPKFEKGNTCGSKASNKGQKKITKSSLISEVDKLMGKKVDKIFPAAAIYRPLIEKFGTGSTKQIIARVIIAKCFQGDFRFINMVTSYLDSEMKIQNVNMSGELNTNEEQIVDLRKLSDDEFEQYKKLVGKITVIQENE